MASAPTNSIFNHTAFFAALEEGAEPSFVPSCETRLEIDKVLKEFFPGMFYSLNIQVDSVKDNTVYKITDNNFSPPQLSVIRKAFSTWTKDQCQEEIIMAKLAADVGVGPKILQVSSDDRFTRIQYMNGEVVGPDAP
ncbi:MAG: hypothetical protein WCJ72_18165 [Chryseobacterium sp.]